MRRILFPLIPVYRLIIWLRNYLYDKGWLKIYRPDVPVVSIGNISTGGTGKTPLAEYMIDFYLKEANIKKLAYLSRGYGRKTKGFFKVDPGKGTAKDFGDEALQVAGKFPEISVAVCEDRKTGIRRLIDEYHADFIILDDAFQHRKVDRDKDIVVIDATRMPDRDLVLPAGNLREPISGLKRADYLVVNKVEEEAQIPGLRKRLERWHKPVIFCRPVLNKIVFPVNSDLLEIRPGMKVMLFSGIGNAGSFQQTIREAGYEIVVNKEFRDHYFYRERDIRMLIDIFGTSQADCMLTTEKDYWRLRGSSGYQRLEPHSFGYVRMKLEWIEDVFLPPAC